MNRGELKTMVMARLRIDATETGRVTQIETVLNQEYARLAADLGLLFTQTGLDFTAGTATVLLPTDFLSVRYAYRASAGSGASAVVLQPSDAEGFAALLAGQAAGTTATPSGPSIYVVEGVEGTTSAPQPQLRFWPTPSSTTTGGTGFTLAYEKRVTSMTTDTGTGATANPVALPGEYHDALAERTIARLAPEQEAWGIRDAATQEAERIIAMARDQLHDRQGPIRTRLVLRGYQ